MRYKQSIFALIGVMVFLLYPGLCQLSFSALKCRTISPELQVLEADCNIDCTSDTYQLFRIFAVLESILIPIGECLFTIPAL